jgi:primase-polymerase (primpol)-like protein
MTKMLVHRGTGTYFAMDDDAWVIDIQHIDDETGEINDETLLAHGQPIIDVIPDYNY